MKIQKILIGFFFLILFFSKIPFVFSDDQELTDHGTPYACTGVAESKEDPRWKSYPLKLVFTGSGRAFVTEVTVVVSDSSGQESLHVSCDAPWLVAKLKPGHYSISATAKNSRPQKTSVTVPVSGQAEKVIRFTDLPNY